MPSSIPRLSSTRSRTGLGKRLADHIHNRVTESKKPGTLRLSNIGTECHRKLWFSIREPQAAEPLPRAARFKFLFGDILEELLLFLAEEAGHSVEGRQTTLSVNGVEGHRDAIIDGRLVDVKSASTNLIASSNLTLFAEMTFQLSGPAWFLPARF